MSSYSKSKIHQIASLCIASALFVGFAMNGISSALPANKDYQSRKYGLFVHYVWGGTGTARPGPLAPNKDGTKPYANIDSMTSHFPVEQFVNDIASMGVEYIIFTCWHYNMNPLYPSAKMGQWMAGLPDKTSNRDLIRDLINALNPKGIKLYLYIHPDDGHDFNAAEKLKVGYDDAAGGYATYNNFMNDMYSEVVSRYKDYVSGYWCDEIGAGNGRIDATRLRNTIRSCDSNALAFSNSTVPLQDIISWEVTGFGPGSCCAAPFVLTGMTANDVNTWPGVPDHVSILEGSSWWPSQAQGQQSARYSAKSMFKYTVLQAGSNARGMGVAWAAGPYSDGGWETGVLENMQQLGLYITPIASSVKGTHPSTSYPNAPGTTINDLTWGVATKSLNELTEYIHVLKPPSGSVLNLPPPLDSKVFTSASMLRSGVSAILIQNTTGVHITVPEAWDSLNTVIKLTVDPASVVTKVNLAQHAALSASSSVENYDWGAAKSVDGQQFSVAGAMGWTSSNSLMSDHAEWIIVKLDSAYKVCEVGLTPRTDGNKAGYGFPVDFTINVSTDSLNWTTVATKTAYPLPGGILQRFPFSCLNAKFVKIEGTSLRPNPYDANYYRMQFAEIEVFEVIGNQQTSAAPSRKHGSATTLLTNRNYMNVTGLLSLGPMYSGKTVAVYDLGGRMLGRKNIANNRVDLRKDFGLTAGGVHIMRVKTQ